MGTDVQSPPPRDYYSETKDTLQAKVDLAPDLYAAEAQYRPKYAELDLSIAEKIRPRLMENYRLISDALASQQASSLASQREADVEAVERLGPRATEAFRSANPQQMALIDRLNRSAQMGLDSGMDPQMIRDVQQGARGAQVARGLGYGIGDAALEAMQVGWQGEAYRARQRQGAMQVAALNQATQGDPFMQILGRPSAVTPQAAMAGFGQAAAFNPGQLFNPESGYAADIYNTNFNAQLNANIASANNRSALIGGGIGAVGNIAGGALAGRWWKP